MGKSRLIVIFNSRAVPSDQSSDILYFDHWPTEGSSRINPSPHAIDDIAKSKTISIRVERISSAYQFVDANNGTDHPARADDMATTNRQPEGWGGSDGSPGIVSLIVIEGFELKAPV